MSITNIFDKISEDILILLFDYIDKKDINNLINSNKKFTYLKKKYFTIKINHDYKLIYLLLYI